MANQKKRGRSLTRQAAVKGSSKKSEEELYQIPIKPNSQEERPMINKPLKLTKSSPTKYAIKKEEASKINRKSPSTPKTPTYEDAKKQLNLNYSETKNNQFSSRTPSNNTSLASSREQTPNTPISSKKPQHKGKPEFNVQLFKCT